MGQFDSIVFDFLSRPDSSVPVVSDDDLFKRNLRSIFQKTLGVKREVIQTFAKPTSALKFLKERLENKQPTLLFCEGLLQGRQTTDFIATLKSAYPDLLVIALVAETNRETIAYLYEVGSNNVISKPASANNVVEKMAFTIQPQGKLSSLVGAAKGMLRKKEFQKVLTVCGKIIKIKPGSPTGLMLAGDAYIGLGQRDRARAAYEQAHKGAEVFIEPIKRLADFHKEHDEAAHLFYLKKLDDLSPLHAGRKRDIGIVHLQKGDPHTAEGYFDKAMECANREAIGIVAGMAESIASAVADTSPNMAEKYLNQALDAKGDDLTPRDLETFNSLGIALKAQGKWKESIECYRKALTVAPKDEGLHYNLGMALFEGKQLQEAVKAFLRALKLNPDFYIGLKNVTSNLANVFMEAGDSKLALTFVDHGLELSPGNASFITLKHRIETNLT